MSLRHSSSHEKPTRAKGDMVKVVIPLEQGWHGFGSESVWAEEVAPGTYRLLNVPFYAKGLGLDDIIIAQHEEGELVFQKASQRSGHSTYRVFTEKGVENPTFRLRWRRLESLGVSYEQAGSLLAVDVPPSSDIHEIYRNLEEGAAEGVWDFDEGYCGHALGSKE